VAVTLKPSVTSNKVALPRVPHNVTATEPVHQVLVGTLNRIALVASGDLAAIASLPRLITAVEALIEGDLHWQRQLRTAVVVALAKIPYKQNTDLPARHGLRVLHGVLCKEGAKKALDRLAQADVPKWSDIIRVYRPDYAAGNVATLKTHAENVAERTEAPVPGKPLKPVVTGTTVNAVRIRRETVRKELVKLDWLINKTKDMEPETKVPAAFLVEYRTIERAKNKPAKKP
jgi:hypothetical protein